MEPLRSHRRIPGAYVPQRLSAAIRVRWPVRVVPRVLHGGGEVIQTTTPGVDGRTITEYLGVVTGEAILGANIVRDLFAGIRDIVGGRSGAYEEELRKAREIAMQELAEEATARGADAVVGIDLDYETVGQGGSMLMVTVSGTAVRLGA